VTAPDRVLLPDGTRLVHIGPHKTGTTTLQAAFHLARRDALRQGVRYAGPNRQPVHAAQAVAAIRDGSEPPRIRSWRHLVGDVLRAKEPRVVISSEWFSEARAAGIRRIATDLDPARIHVAVTLRPLGRILASQWQQLAQSGWSTPFDRWLETIFRNPDAAEGARFWHRHAHGRLVKRWVEVVGPDRLTVVVVDDRDRGAMLRAFERLTGLEVGTLVAPDDRRNRSLTLAEVELVRELHRTLKPLGLESTDRLNLVLFGIAGHLKLRVPDAAEARIETPGWAVEESAAVARKAVAEIRATGVRVIGDLDSLAMVEPVPAALPPTDAPPSPADWPALAASASMGLLGFSGLARAARSREAPDAWPDGAATRAKRTNREPEPTSPAFRGLEAMDALSTARLFGIFEARLSQSLRARLPGAERVLRGEAESR
jgi:hypothetical protein